MKEQKFPASLPRKMYWSDEVGGHASCPDCGGLLEAERYTYVMATRQREEMDFHMAGNNAGWFCGNCPVVVLDRNEFERSVVVGVGTTPEVQYVVLGIVDLDAVPADKRHLPFNDDTNPLPIVKFTNLPGGTSSRRRGSGGSGRRKERRRKKRRQRR